jgi:outer membrane immunogenic protein
MRILAITALALATVATPAFAQEEHDFNAGHIKIIGGLDSVDDGVSDDNGGVYGVAAGYDFDLGAFVGGIEGEATLAATKACITTACVEAGRDLYGGVRIGVKVGGASMLYVKGGYTNAQVNGTLSGAVITREEFDGVRVGIGAQTVVGRNLYFNIEYRYSNYEQDVERSQAVIGVGFSF